LTSELETGWARSTRISYVGDTFQPLMVFQGLKDRSQDFLYLSFDVRVDNSFDNNDTIILVFRPSFSTTGHTNDERRIDIAPLSTGIGAGKSSDPPIAQDTPAVPAGAPASSTYSIKAQRNPRNVEYRKWNASTSSWVTQADLNFDIKVRSWVLGTTNKNWSVEIKVPTSITAAGVGNEWINLDPNGFGFYFNVIRVCGSGSCTSGSIPTGTFAANQFTWPRADYATCNRLIFNGMCGGNAGGTGPIGQREIPSAWLGEAAINPTTGCQGVRFQNGPDGIGIRDPAHATDPLGSVIDANLANTFTARLENIAPGPTPSPALGVRAEFRIANFGIGGGVGSWDPIPLPTPPAANSNPTARQSINPTGTTDLTAAWTLSLTDKARYCNPSLTSCPPGKLDSHQCLWVLLDSDQNVDFTESSVRRNMDFVNLSTFTRQAEISGKDYPSPPAGQTDQDFFLQVNHVRLVSLRDLSGRPPGGLITSASTGGHGLGLDQDMISPLEEAIYRRQAASSGIVSTWVWMMHGYRNTGASIIIDGTMYAIQEPVGGFGYIADHNGRVKDFNYQVSGAELRSLPNNPDGYTLPVPNGGVRVITTRLEAVEAANGPGLNGKRWGLSLHAGANFPHGSFNTFSSGFSFTADLEYRINQNFSLEGLYGFNRFKPGLNLHNLSANGKFYFGSASTRPFFNAGVGAYVFGSGTVHAGANLGAGLQFNVNPKFAVEAAYNFHEVFTSGSHPRFSTLQGGIRFRF
jgi:opacity protein-like surface antigen